MDKIACDICGSCVDSVVFEKEDKGVCARILKCSHCGLVFIYPQETGEKGLRNAYQRVPAYSSMDIPRYNNRLKRLKSPSAQLVLQECYGYPKKGTRKAVLCARLYARFIKYFLMKSIIPFRSQGRILDVGCDRGFYLLLLKELGWDVYGVEVNPYACREAEKRGLNVFCGELNKAHFEDNYFDVVRIAHVIEHVASPLEMLTEIKRILKPGGVVYLEAPNQDSFASRCFKENWLRVQRHIYAFSPVTLEFLCRRVGLCLGRIRFKSSKGTTLKALNYFFTGTLLFSFFQLILQQKVLRKFILEPLCFFLNLSHQADVFSAEIMKPA